MAVTRVGTESSHLDSTTGTNSYDLSHTVPSGASLLLVAAGMTGHRAFNGLPTWDGDDMTQIGLVENTSSSDTDIGLWGFISPAAKTANVNVAWTNSDEPFWVCAVNYAGTETASVAAATNLLETVNDTANVSTTAFASGGTSGNALFLAASAVGDDRDPASNDGGFTEILDAGTGGGAGTSDDLCAYIAELLSGLPSAVTITWAGGADEASGFLVELVAAASSSSSLPPILPYYQNILAGNQDV